MGSEVPSHSESRLQAVASAAAAGLATASVTDVADDILKFPTQPKLPVVEKKDTLPQNIAQNFDPAYIPVMIILDLMLSSSKTWDVCNKLMNVIKPYLPTQEQTAVSAQSSDSKSSATGSKQRVAKIRTITDFCTQIQSLLNLGEEDEIPSKEQMMLSKAFQKSAQYFLCHSNFSLTADKNRDFASLCQSLSKYVSRVEEAFSQNKVKTHLTPESPGRSGRSGSPVSRSPSSRLHQETPAIHHCMKQLINVLEKDVPTSGIICVINK